MEPLKKSQYTEKQFSLQCMLSDHNGIILDINKRKTSGKFPDVWQLNNTLVKNSGIKEEFKGEIRKCFAMN